MDEDEIKFNTALWGNLVSLNLWVAVYYIKPGFFPLVAGMTHSVVVLWMRFVKERQ